MQLLSLEHSRPARMQPRRLSIWLDLAANQAAVPLAYAAGERLSVLTLESGATWAVALQWALAVPLLAVGARVRAGRVRA